VVVVDLVGFQLDWEFTPPITTTSTRTYGFHEPHRSEDEDQPVVGAYVAGSRRSEQGERVGSREAKSDTNCEQELLAREEE